MSNGRLLTDERNLLAAIEEHARSLAGGDMSNGRLNKNERDLLAEIEYRMRTLAEGGVVKNALFGPMPGYTIKSEKWLYLAAGTTDLNFATPIPSGHKLFVPLGMQLFNYSGSTNSWAVRQVRGAQVAPLFGAPTNISNAGSMLFGSGNGVAFYPGDSIQVYNSLPDCGLAYWGYLVPDGSSVVPIAEFLASGSNTLYTCPAGKVAAVGAALGCFQTGFFRIGNASGATRNYEIHVVPNGQSLGASTLVSRWYSNVHTNGQTFAYVMVNPVLLPGDSLIIVSDGGGDQLAYGIVYEFDAE